MIASSGTERDLLRKSQPFVASRNSIAWAQVLSTLVLFAACLIGLGLMRGSWSSLLLAPVLAATFVRMFVLFHDAGHASLFAQRSLNRMAGRTFAAVMGISYEGWRHEHNWHHANQGKLSHRGIDSMNSPMTEEEGLADPVGAARRSSIIKLPNIFVLGSISLLVSRKRLRGFFPFRAKFRWPVPYRDAVQRDLAWTTALHASLHLVVLVALGLPAWVTMSLAMFLGAGVGSLLFWVQHNFPSTYHASDETWSFIDVARHGSSYLRLPRLLAWITCDIGLHHVHHLNPCIPNYRLKEALGSLPELSAVQPLSHEQFWACFRNVFWSQARGRMVTREELNS